MLRSKEIARALARLRRRTEPPVEAARPGHVSRAHFIFPVIELGRLAEPRLCPRAGTRTASARGLIELTIPVRGVVMPLRIGNQSVRPELPILVSADSHRVAVAAGTDVGSGQ